MSNYKIKLQPGDYCRRDMGEDKYRECAQRFFDDGCPKHEAVSFYAADKYFGWTHKIAPYGFYHHTVKDYFGGRMLTHEQIMEKETMTEPDWKTAPKGATHWNKNNNGYYKILGEDIYLYHANDQKWIDSTYSRNSFSSKNEFIKSLIKLPAQPAWHETGDLPPVGTECEAIINEEWHKVQILKYNEANIAACHLLESRVDGSNLKWSGDFRPIQSDRDKAIEELTSLVWGCNEARVTAAKIYEAGFRKPDQDLKSQLDDAEMWKGALSCVLSDLTCKVSQAYSNQPFPYMLQLAYDRATEILGNIRN
jgi:hypothetical protein